ncbi:MAG: xanthine dehydrogenase family protein [Candidatus Cloacimonetes bacterium]|nr:xanthine dehydrogenase family protein [Candidatus Cloacimonadota bacterium]
MNSKNKEIRVDATSKISGKEKYLRDFDAPNRLFATTVRSARASALIKKIEFSKNFDWSDITIITAKDIPNNYVAMIKNDMPYLAENQVNCFGEPIILLAAESLEKLELAKSKIKIEYEDLPAILGIEQSENSRNKKNIFENITIKSGDFSVVKKEADFIIKEEFKTGYQEHVYLEPQVAMAVPDGNTIHIFGSMQCPYYVQNAMDELFKGTEIKTDVTQTSTGGAFGGKEDFPSLICGHVALLTQKSKRPVLLSFSREEDVKFTTKRHPSKITGKAAVTKSGKILGLKIELKLDSGAYSTLSPVVLARAVLCGAGCYNIPNVKIHGLALKTNKIPSGAFRGFGAPQAFFAIEMLIDKIARKLNLSPLEIRKKNLLKLNDKMPTGQPINYSFGLHKCLENVIKMSDFERKYLEYKNFNKTQGRQKKLLKGIGLSTVFHGAGFTGIGENRIKAIAEMELISGGKIIIRTANTEMGQGIDTAFKIIVSDKLKIPFSDIIIEEKNTSKVPDSGPTVASRSTMIVGKLLVDNCDKILKRFRETKIDIDEKLSFTDKAKKYYTKFGTLKVKSQYKHPDFIKFDETTYTGYGYPVYSWSASIAEIEIDLVTYQVKVKKFYTSHDIGKAINYQQSIGQILGGTVQGIGFAIYEDMPMNKGEIQNTGFADYIIPTTMDIPDIEVDIVEEPYFFGPEGAKALGELPLVGVAPAIASAVSQAVGKTICELPITPEKIQEILYEN